MEATISPVDRMLIEKELTLDKFVRHTNNGNNLLYVVNHYDSPYTMQEIGRLREVTFRAAGGGTGKSVDIDEFDTRPNGYQQLIVWDPKALEILGGYRYINCAKCDGPEDLATSELFHFSDEFKENYFPQTIELGRSFVQPNYQNTGRHNKGLYALDNLWDGLGALVIKYPKTNYFFGKVTMYGSFNEEARNALLYFLKKHFSDKNGLVTPIIPLETHTNQDKMQEIFVGKDYKEDYKILSKFVREHGENIPPLINSYMNLSPSMKVFGTAINASFGNVEETGILVKISDIYAEKIERYTAPLRKIKNTIKWLSQKER